MFPSQRIEELIDEFTRKKSIALFLGAGIDITNTYPEDDNLKVSLVSTDQKYNDLLNEIATSNKGCIWADEFLSILKEYIQTWKKYSRQEHLHIIIDNIANIDFFPLMKREKSLIPAIVNVCRSESMYKGYEDTG